MKTLSLYLFVLIALTSALFSQEIPNGDGDLLWERSLGGRFVNDAKFHPINGNIIAAVNHEIWEIDPKDGHTIRVFEGGYTADANDAIKTINITFDGQKIITGGAMGQKGILIWDYNTGLVTKIVTLKEIFDVYENIGIYPENNRILFNTYQNDYGSQYNVMHINVYDILLDSIIKRVNITDTYCARFRISENGQFIAYGFAKGKPGDFNYTMELWDAETLTKIKDFGEAKAGDFKDIQFSENNNYIGFLGSRILYLINQEFNSQQIYEGAYSFAFSNDSRNILVERDTSWGKMVVYIHNLQKNQIVYEYRNSTVIFRFNNDNQLFTGRESGGIKFYSKNWYEVGVKPNFELNTQVSYENDKLILTLPNEVIPQKISIMNILGEIVYQATELTELNDKIVLDLTLPSGVYLISLNDGQSTFYGKFVVVR
jgi:WD40 repeat protein